ncbi:MAG: hypothetical protein AB7P40_29740 [Chloroflexota bacterium]
MNYQSAAAGLQRRFIELRSLVLETHTIAAALMLRSVVETTAKEHYAQRGVNATGMLGGLARDHLAPDYRSLPALRTAIDRLRDGKDHQPGSVNWFNQVAHGAHHVVRAQDVRDAWQILTPLVRFLLQPEPPADRG